MLEDEVLEENPVDVEVSEFLKQGDTILKHLEEDPIVVQRTGSAL